MPLPQLTLDQLITEACELFAPADAPTRYYGAALIHAKAFRRKLITSTSRETQTVMLEIGPDRTVELPEDYVEYERLGVYCEALQGVCGLRYAEGVPIALRGTMQPHEYPYDWMRLGGFRIDLEQRRIVCTSLVPAGTLVLLDYKRFAAPTGEDIAIDPLAHTWAVQYILTELHRQKENWTAMQVAATERDREYSLYKQAIRNFTLGGVLRVKHLAAAQSWK